MANFRSVLAAFLMLTVVSYPTFNDSLPVSYNTTVIDTGDTNNADPSWSVEKIIGLAGGILSAICSFIGIPVAVVKLVRMYRKHKRKGKKKKPKNDKEEMVELLDSGTPEQRLKKLKDRQKEKLQYICPLPDTWRLDVDKNNQLMMAPSYTCKEAVVTLPPGTVINSEDKREYRDTVEIDFDKLFTNPIPKDNCRRCDGPGQLMLITGDAGSGKTTQAQHYAYQWANQDTLDNFVIFLPLRHLSKYTNIQDMLKGYCGIEIVDLSEYRGCLVLEGLDEVKDPPKQIKEFLQSQSKFSSETEYPKIKVIVTSRPHPSSFEKMGIEPDVRVKLKGVKKDAYIEFMRHYFKYDESKDANYIKDVSAKWKKLQIVDMLENPFIVVLLCMLFQKGMVKKLPILQNEIPKTRTALFNAFFEILLQRFEERKKPRWLRWFWKMFGKKRKQFDCHPLEKGNNVASDMRDFLAGLSKICFDKVMKQEYDISASELKNPEYKVNEEMLQTFGIFCEDSTDQSEISETNPDNKSNDSSDKAKHDRIFVMRHKLFVEYLAALHMVKQCECEHQGQCDCRPKDLDKLFKETEGTLKELCKESTNIFQFGVGMSSKFYSALLEKASGTCVIYGSPTRDLFLQSYDLCLYQECSLNNNDKEASKMLCKYLCNTNQLPFCYFESNLYPDDIALKFTEALRVKEMKNILQKLFDIQSEMAFRIQEVNDNKYISDLPKEQKSLDCNVRRGNALKMNLQSTLFCHLLKHLTFKNVKELVIACDEDVYPLNSACSLLESFESIEKLKLHNFFIELPVNESVEMGNWKSMQCIHLYKCKIEDWGALLRGLEKFQNIIELKLLETQFNVESRMPKIKLPRLEKLAIKHNEDSDGQWLVELLSSVNMPSLQTLDISNNVLGSKWVDILEILSDNNSLKELDMYGCDGHIESVRTPLLSKPLNSLSSLKSLNYCVDVYEEDSIKLVTILKQLGVSCLEQIAVELGVLELMLKDSEVSETLSGLEKIDVVGSCPFNISHIDQACKEVDILCEIFRRPTFKNITHFSLELSVFYLCYLHRLLCTLSGLKLKHLGLSGFTSVYGSDEELKAIEMNSLEALSLIYRGEFNDDIAPILRLIQTPNLNQLKVHCCFSVKTREHVSYLSSEGRSNLDGVTNLDIKVFRVEELLEIIKCLSYLRLESIHIHTTLMEANHVIDVLSWLSHSSSTTLHTLHLTDPYGALDTLSYSALTKYFKDPPIKPFNNVVEVKDASGVLRCVAKSLFPNVTNWVFTPDLKNVMR